MTNKERTEMYRSFLTQEGFSAKITDDGHVSFKHEGGNYLIQVDENDEEFFRVIYPAFWPIENDTGRREVMQAALSAMAETKVVKVFPVGDDMWAAIEMFCAPPEVFKPVFRRSLLALKAGVDSVRKQMGPSETTAASKMLSSLVMAFATKKASAFLEILREAGAEGLCPSEAIPERVDVQDENVLLAFLNGNPRVIEKIIKHSQFIAFAQSVHSTSTAPASRAPSLASSPLEVRSTYSSGLDSLLGRSPPHSSRRGGCFVATATFGSPLASDVSLLRAWRDTVLRGSVAGRIGIRYYEAIGPFLARAIQKSALLKRMFRILLTPFVALARSAQSRHPGPPEV